MAALLESRKARLQAMIAERHRAARENGIKAEVKLAPKWSKPPRRGQ
jgi:hypothetical protein